MGLARFCDSFRLSVVIVHRTPLVILHAALPATESLPPSSSGGCGMVRVETGLFRSETGLELSASKNWEIENHGLETGRHRRPFSGFEWSLVMLWRNPVWPNRPNKRRKFQPFRYSLQSRDWLAGAEGIEPSNAGIKIQCLTTWRRPKAVVRAGTI